MSLRRLSLAAAAVLVAASGVSAQTPPIPEPIDLIATLDSVCVAAQGDRARAAGLAIEGGFSPVPDSMVPGLRNSSETAGFMRSNATDITFVMTGQINRRLGRERVVMEFCGVTARPTDHRALDLRLREVMGFNRVRGGGLDVYAWVQTPEGRAPSRSLTDPEFIAMAQTGQMRLVGLDRSGPGSTLIYFLPRID